MERSLGGEGLSQFGRFTVEELAELLFYLNLMIGKTSILLASLGA